MQKQKKQGENGMNITKSLNGKKLEIALEGRLDTLTAPELEIGRAHV